MNNTVLSILIPGLFVLSAAFFEVTCNLSKGTGSNLYRCWIKRMSSDGSHRLLPISNLSLTDVKSLGDKVVRIEQSVSFDPAEYGSIGIDLIIATFVIDALSLLANQVNMSNITLLISAHFAALISIGFFVALNHVTSPGKRIKKRFLALFAIAIGAISLGSTFFNMQ